MSQNTIGGSPNKKEDLLHSKRINLISTSFAEGVKFFEILFEVGMGYSGVNTARSALSAVVIQENNLSFGNHSSEGSFMKDVFEIIPSPLKHKHSRDLHNIGKFPQTLNIVENFNLKKLKLKLTMLFPFISAHKFQTLKALSIERW